MKYSTSAAILAFASEVVAFPGAMELMNKGSLHNIDRRGLGLPSTDAARQLSADRTNCGAIPCLTFNAEEQFVSTSGSHAFAPPGETDIRGPCPGLNAAANHGYLPRSGIATIPTTINGLGQAFGLGPDASAVLALYAILFDGDPIRGEWSIGGPTGTDTLTLGILGQAQGLSYSHNIYEGDASIGRNDAYLNNGDAHSLNVTRFATAFATGLDDDRYTLDKFASHFENNTLWSIENNPLYFSAPFATVVVSPAAYNFVINLMSNHSQEEPSGYLNGAMFKTFFAVEGEYPNFTWNKGHERIPDNWYRRPGLTPYGLANIGGDLAVQWLAYPSSFRLGGNINGVNTFVGVDLGDITGGVYQATDLLDLSGNNATCFITQLIQSVTPNILNTLLSDLSPVLNVVNDIIEPLVGNLSCPAIEAYSQTPFNQFPGYHYSPRPEPGSVPNTY